MPIPAFDHNLVLPPHLGDPRNPSEISPYPCSTTELCDRFATSLPRIEILTGFLRLRSDLGANGVVQGFQWIDGSFLQDIEIAEGRAPGDIDVVTFYWDNDPDFPARLQAELPQANSPALAKATYHVDHYLIDINYHPEFTVEVAGYWCGLFSHTRDSVWKGMLRVQSDTPDDDASALDVLRAAATAMEVTL